MKKKYKTGLVIGKFYPFHKGHEYLIQTALNSVEELTVIVCQTDRYKIPAGIRAGWIRNTFPKVNIRIFRHDASLDSDSTDISEKWAKLTVGFLGFIPEVVFSSENYGGPYANFMGSKHVLVDQKRIKFPVSGTAVRQDIYKNWEFLPEETKKYFSSKVVVIGAESTGTTTLARDLAKYYQTVWVPEYGRYYYEGKMFSKKSDNWNTDEFVHIAKMQNKFENGLIKQSDKILICDTDAFATTVWHERYVGHKSDLVDKVVKKEKPLLYIVTGTEIPFVQDGTRDGEQIRQWMHERFLEKLNSSKLNYLVVHGSPDERVLKSVKEINRLLLLR